MTTYGDIATRVEHAVVNPSPYVLTQIPRLVAQAQREAERRHVFAAMRGLWWIETQPGSNETVTGPGALSNPTSARSSSAAYAFLQTLKENPYWGDAATGLPSFTGVTPGAGTELIWLSKGDADGHLKFRITNVLSGGATQIALEGFPPGTGNFRPGMYVTVTDFDGAEGHEWLEGIPFLLESITQTDAVSPCEWELVLRVPDAPLDDGDGLYTGLTFTAVWDTPTDVHPMAWISEEDALRIYATQTVDGDPKHVLERARNEIGEPHFLVYPLHSTDSYAVAIPCALHLGSSLVELPDPLAETWFTNFADVYLESYAAAEAAFLEEDYEKSQRWYTRAEAELRRLISDDKRSSFKALNMRFSRASRGATSVRSPRF